MRRLARDARGRKGGERQSKDRERALVRAGSGEEAEAREVKEGSVGKRAHERAHRERGEEARERTRGHEERGEEARGDKDRDGWHET